MAAAPRPPEPSDWVERFAPLIAAGAPVLDLACGSGRHTRLLADRGHRVTAVDIDLGRLGALAGDARVEAIAADLEGGDGWPLGARTFAGIVITNYLARGLVTSIIGALAPAGVLIWETFAVGNAEFGRPRNPDFLLQPGELYDAIAGRLTIVAFEQGRLHTPRDRVVQRLCAVRRDDLLGDLPTG